MAGSTGNGTANSKGERKTTYETAGSDSRFMTGIGCRYNAETPEPLFYDAIQGSFMFVLITLVYIIFIVLIVIITIV